MAEREPSASPTDESTASGRSRSWWPVLAPAAALLVGLVLGGVLVGVVADEDTDSAAEGAPSASPSPGDADATPSASATVIVVPDQCLAAVDTVEQALDLADRTAAAIRDFQPDELRQLLREIEELDQQARAQAQACQEIQTDQTGPTAETS